MNRFLNSLLDLLPKGKLWNRSKNSNLYRLMLAIADEFDTFYKSILLLVDEFFPNTATSTLERWEDNFGLPEKSTGSDNMTVEERRSILIQKFNDQGGSSLAYHKEQLGLDAEIVEYKPFRVDQSRVGDPLSNAPEWRHTFRIILKDFIAYYFRAGVSRVGEPLARFENETIKCLIERIKPAHTHVLYSFKEDSNNA